jgi:hypothetical protein
MSAPVHEMTDNKRGWRCSCGEWLHASATDLIELTRSKHLARWNDLAESCWTEARDPHRLINAVKAYRNATGCSLGDALAAIRACPSYVPS